MAPSAPANPGGLRREDVRQVPQLKEAAASLRMAGRPPWRIYSTVLQKLPLRTGTLLSPDLLEHQLSSGLRPEFSHAEARLRVGMLSRAS